MTSSNDFTYRGFQNSKISIDDIQDRLDQANKSAITTGVKVLDDVFGGILSSDILLVGAKTGAGKTALAAQIGLNNALKGKSVYMFALEAEKDEIQTRVLYEMAVAKAKSYNPRSRYNYKHFRLGRYPELKTYMEDASKEVDDFKNFHIFYRDKEFGIKEFVKETMAIKDKASLIIVDHIHYFDLNGDNENKELSDAIKQIRDISLIMDKPIILLAHLRKSSNVAFKLVPDIDDFMGSSDLSKVATKALIIAPKRSLGDSVETLFYFPKFRGFSAPSKYLFSCHYDIYQNQYANTYTVYNFKYNNINFNFPENIVDNEELSWLG